METLFDMTALQHAYDVVANSSIVNFFVDWFNAVYELLRQHWVWEEKGRVDIVNHGVYYFLYYLFMHLLPALLVTFASIGMNLIALFLLYGFTIHIPAVFLLNVFRMIFRVRAA